MVVDNKKLANDELCSQVWLNPIKSTGKGVQKMGIEMEMLAFDAQTFVPIGCEGSQVSPQMLMERILEEVPGSTAKVDEKSKLITMVNLPEGGNFSLEPGGQVEYSSSPCTTFTEMANVTKNSLKILEKVSRNQIVYLSHGTNPLSKPNHPLLLPKERYEIMTRYFQSAPQNIRGEHMMRHCATVQANLDVFGDANWRDAVHLTTVLVPLTQYLFANSAYFQGNRSVYLSERQNVWAHMDPSRSGFPFDSYNQSFVENPECSYATWARKASVFFVESLPLEHQPLYQELTFAQWMKEGYKGIKPTVEDWQTHLGTLFPHLRLRQFLEVRHIDAQPFEHTFASICFFAALIQSDKTRIKTWELIRSFDFNLVDLFSGEEKTYQEIHLPLLRLSRDILQEQGEEMAAKAILAYEHFLSQKEDYWKAESALDFVKKKCTQQPSAEFFKYLQ